MVTVLYLWAKKIHRLCIIFIVLLTFVMAGTGTLMNMVNYGIFFPWINYKLLLFIHSRTSPFFTLTLLVMLTTGLYMYFFPHIKKN